MINILSRRSILGLASLLLCGLLVTGPLTSAWAAKPVAKHRHKNQVGRIKQGVKSGELTKKEAHKLRKGQKRVRKAAHQAKNDDGRIDRKERARINRMQNRQSKRIFKQKHDRQDRH